MFVVRGRMLRIGFCKKLQCIFPNILKRSIGEASDNNINNHYLSKETLAVDAGGVKRLENVACDSYENANGNAETPRKFEQAQVAFWTRNTNTDYLADVKEKAPSPFDRCSEDLSYIGPNVTPTYNFAKFANSSDTIQQLVNLGVELHKLERKRHILQQYLSLQFEKDIKPYLFFLKRIGIPTDSFGRIITLYPEIFMEDVNILTDRIKYMQDYGFTKKMIELIIYRNPSLLSAKRQQIDEKLNYFQSKYKLSVYETRCLCINCPKLLTRSMKQLNESLFVVKEIMGFSQNEIKLILLTAPTVWIMGRKSVTESFHYAHEIMQLSHTLIAKQSKILLCRKIRLQQRHEFLKQLNRAQYDPTKPLYVSAMSLITGSDETFCTNVAKVSVETYDMYLKS